jgi:hypothetical protein
VVVRAGLSQPEQSARTPADDARNPLVADG